MKKNLKKIVVTLLVAILIVGNAAYSIDPPDIEPLTRVMDRR